MKNEEKILIEITKKQAHLLHKKGIPFGENGISHTLHNRHYYLCESKDNLRLLDKIKQK